MSQAAAIDLGLDGEVVPYRVMLTLPDGEPLLEKSTGEQAWIEVDGYNSEAGEELLKKAKLSAATRGRRPEKEVDIDKARAENAHSLARLARGWFLVNAKTGEAIPAEAFPCTYENARAFFGDKKRSWITTQVITALQDSSNFIKT